MQKYTPPIKFPEPWNPLEVYLFRMVPVEVAIELFQNESGIIGTATTAPLQTYSNYQLAKPNMPNKRDLTKVEWEPFGTLQDYVSFYFAPRSPMLYSLHKKNEEGSLYEAERIVYIVTQIQNVVDAKRSFVFTNMHALIKFACFDNKLDHLQQNLDVEILEAEYFTGNKGELKKSDYRQAEFLVYQYLPLTAVQHIRVHNQDIHNELSGYLPERLKNRIKIKSNWYF